MPGVEDARVLAAELLEEALHHLGALGNALAAVRDAGLLDPLLEVFRVLVDVRVDVREDLLQVGRQLAVIRLEVRIGRAERMNPDLRLGRAGAAADTVAALWLQPDTAINAPTKHSDITFVTVISSNKPCIRDGPFDHAGCAPYIRSARPP